MAKKNHDQAAQFAAKAILLGLPFLILSATYFLWDPFQVLYSRGNYYENCRVEPNRDMASTETYLRYAESQQYDSFIFGSSRSLSFQCKDWASLMPGIKPYHFDAAKESLFGIWKKVQFLDARGQKMNYVLLAFDSELLGSVENSHSRLFIKHPAVSGGSRFEFQVTMFASYFQRMFFLKYMDFKFFGKNRPWSKDAILKKPMRYVLPTNDAYFWPDSEWLTNPEKYFRDRKKTFYERRGRTMPKSHPVIGERAKDMLRDIHRIFRNRGVEVQVVINPLYDQAPFNGADKLFLMELFGNDRVHDFSGRNKITENPLNYYDNSHFKPAVGYSILKDIFRSTNTRLTGSARRSA